MNMNTSTHTITRPLNDAFWKSMYDRYTDFSQGKMNLFQLLACWQAMAEQARDLQRPAEQRNTPESGKPPAPLGNAV